MGMRSIGGGGVQRLASGQVSRVAASNCWGSDMIVNVQLMGGADAPRGVEFDIEPPFHLKLRGLRRWGGGGQRGDGKVK